MLKSTIREELKQSMLAKDTLKTSTLRMLISALGYYEIQKGGAGYEATDEDVMSVIQKEVKQRKDSMEQFEKGGRMDLVEKEKAELEILKKYMPEQMDESEVKMLVDQAVKESGAQSNADIGKVMGVLMPKVKGKADGSLVARIVQEALSQK